ncbi:MAG TPA: efflux RND transporter periplasmic adaptor subunit [Thermoanaerobaculia bacterium]|nr:efflux RND transporter periplasmic adaptor subunit [Thermoanaerobaculia bacterium]
MTKKTAVWLLIAAAVAVGLFFLIGSRGKPEAKYRTAVVDKGDITQTVTATGALSAVTTVKVGSQVSGIISRLYVDFNSQVKKGALLAELDPTPFQEKVNAAAAALQKAQVDERNGAIALRRQTALKAEGLAPEADFDAAQANFDSAHASVAQANAALKQAKTDLSYTKIVAPIDGVVVDRQYDVGQTVAASFQAPMLFQIAQDLTKMQVSADVSESDIGRVQVGEPVRFTVDAYPERNFRGKVAQIRLIATVNQNVVTYPVIVEVPNPDLLLRPTMTANVTIDVAVVHDVLRVPNAALRWKPEGTTASAAAGSSVEERAAKSGGNGTGAMARQFGQTGGTGAAGSRPGGGRGARPTTIYAAPQGPKVEPKPVEIRTGITDGRFTQIVSGEIKPGDSVIVGLATAKASASGSAPPGAGPGGPRRGF